MKDNSVSLADDVVTKLIRQGNSLVLPITKIAKEYSIEPGEYLLISIKRLHSQPTLIKSTTYNPAPIGDKILASMSGTTFTYDELLQLLDKYSLHGEQYILVSDYVLDRCEKTKDGYVAPSVV